MSEDEAAIQGHYPNILRAILAMPWAIDHDSVAWAAIVDVLALRSVGHGLSDAEISARIAGAQNGPRQGGSRQVGIATIPVYGVISPRQNMLARSSGGTTAEAIAASFRAAMADPDVDGIVLDIDSPGGAVEGMEELTGEIRGARGTKPIIAVANHTAASAAYWLASAADEIVASPSGMVGSIGVFTAHDDVSEAQAKLGIKRTVIAGGKHKAEGALGQPLSDDARAHIQGQVDEYYSMMVSAIAKGRSYGGRNVGVDTVRGESYGEGRGVMAKAALAAGMIDRIGTLDSTIRRVARGIATSRVLSENSRAAAEFGIMLAYERDGGREVPPFNGSTIDQGAAQGRVAEAATAAALDSLNGQGTPVSGLPFAHRLELVSAEVEALAVHAREHADMRAKEDRRPSAATRERLRTVAGSLIEIAGSDDPDEPETPTPLAASRRADLEILEAATRGGYQLPN